MSIRIYLEIGHEASIRTKKTQEGFTHDWEVYVKGLNDAEIHCYIEKVVFNLHETFPRPKRVVKEPPYSVKESGYAGFNLPIDIYLRNSQEPKKIRFHYDLQLQPAGPAIHSAQKEKYVFNSPSEDFRERLLKGGGKLTSFQENNDRQVEEKNLMVNKPKMSGSLDFKRQKMKIDDFRNSSTSFQDLFGTPITRTLQDAKPPVSKEGKSNGKTEKAATKGGSKHSPHNKDKDKKPSDLDKRPKDEKKAKDKEKTSKERERSKEKLFKKEKSPSSPKRNSPPRLVSSPQLHKHKHEKEKRDKLDEKKVKKDKRDHKENKHDEHKDKKNSKENIKQVKEEQISSPSQQKEKLREKSQKEDKYKSKKKDKEKREKKEEKAHKLKSKDKNQIKENEKVISKENEKNLFGSPKIEKKDKIKSLNEDDSNNNSSNTSRDGSPIIIEEQLKTVKKEPVIDAKKPIKDESKPKEKNKKDKRDKDYVKKTKRKSDLADVEEPPEKVSRDEKFNGDDQKTLPVKSQEMDEYMDILRDLQHKIMTLKSNDDLQKVVQLIADTGKFEISAHTFDFDLCSLDRSTVQQLQSFFTSET